MDASRWHTLHEAGPSRRCLACGVLRLWHLVSGGQPRRGGVHREKFRLVLPAPHVGAVGASKDDGIPISPDALRGRRNVEFVAKHEAFEGTKNAANGFVA